MTARLRLLSIGHSYIVALNRSLTHEMGRAGQGRWEVTTVAPQYFACHNDLRPLHFAQSGDGARPAIAIPAYFTRSVHCFRYGRRLRALLRESWSLVHCWEEPYTMAAAQVAGLTPEPVPFVFWTAQNVAKSYPPPFCWMERYCLRRCAGWFACGQTTAETQLARGYGSKPSRVMPLGVAVDRFRPDLATRRQTRKELGWDESGPPVVGYLGRFVDGKGLPLLMRVLDRVQTPWRALLVGSGPLAPQLRAWAQRHGCRARVVGDVVHDAVPRYLNAMDLLCVPSQTRPRYREQQGRAITEAWACGVPVIGSDSGEIPYVVADAGVVVAEKNEAAWAAAISDLLESPARRAGLGKRGLARARDVYAWPVIAREHLRFFETLL
jgi:glycosyltransferase involved in cell wall biosynthesis